MRDPVTCQPRPERAPAASRTRHAATGSRPMTTCSEHGHGEQGRRQVDRLAVPCSAPLIGHSKQRRQHARRRAAARYADQRAAHAVILQQLLMLHVLLMDCRSICCCNRTLVSMPASFRDSRRFWAWAGAWLPQPITPICGDEAQGIGANSRASAALRPRDMLALLRPLLQAWRLQRCHPSQLAAAVSRRSDAEGCCHISHSCRCRRGWLLTGVDGLGCRRRGGC